MFRDHLKTFDDSTDSGPPISIAVGITIGLVASSIQSLGLTIQRKSHVLNEQLPEPDRKQEHRRPLWLLGFGIFISSNLLGSLFQIAALPVVILAPLGAVSLLWNALFARFLLGDVFSRWMVGGTIGVAAGAVLIAIFGIVPEQTHSLDGLLRLFGRTAFVIYFSLLGAAVFVCLAATHIAEYSLRKKLVTPPETPPPEPALTVASEQTPLLDPKHMVISSKLENVRRRRLPLAVSYASVSGILSGMCLIFAKSGVELLMLTVQGDNQFWRWESWVLIGGLVVFALLQLWYLHKSLVLADPTLVCPLAFCFYNLSSIVNGLIYFDQIEALTTVHLILVGVGIIVLLAGVWAVSMQGADGDGGVEAGTWQEGDENIEEEEPSEVVAEVVATSAAGPPQRRVVSCPSTPLVMSPGSDSTTMTTTSPRQPSQRRRRRFQSLLGPESSQGSTIPAFQIGLSPISPGFSLRPTGRLQLADTVDDLRMRRAVSESDVGSERARARWKWVKNVWRRLK